MSAKGASLVDLNGGVVSLVDAYDEEMAQAFFRECHVPRPERGFYIGDCGGMCVCVCVCVCVRARACAYGGGGGGRRSWEGGDSGELKRVARAGGTDREGKCAIPHNTCARP